MLTSTHDRWTAFCDERGHRRERRRRRHRLLASLNEREALALAKGCAGTAIQDLADAPDLPISVVTQLVTRPERVVTQRLLQRTDIPTTSQRSLFEQAFRFDLEPINLLNFPTLTDDVQALVVEHGNTAMLTGLAQHPSLTDVNRQRLLARAWDKGELGSVAGSLVKNPSVPTEVIQKVLTYQSDQVLRAMVDSTRPLETWWTNLIIDRFARSPLRDYKWQRVALCTELPVDGDTNVYWIRDERPELLDRIFAARGVDPATARQLLVSWGGTLKEFWVAARTLGPEA